jgi:hypothetical protein
MTSARNRRGSVKSIVVTAAIAVGLAGCLYCYLAYSSLRGEFRAMGVR